MTQLRSRQPTVSLFRKQRGVGTSVDPGSGRDSFRLSLEVVLCAEGGNFMQTLMLEKGSELAAPRRTAQRGGK